jgi:hypothetical protein
VLGLPPDVSQVHQPILVCTAHIHWDPEFCDVKLIQTMMLSNELRSILEEASHSFRPGHKPDTNNIQLLLCGDFNSLPDSGKLCSVFCCTLFFPCKYLLCLLLQFGLLTVSLKYS